MGGRGRVSGERLVYLQRGPRVRRNPAVVLPRDDPAGQRRPRHGPDTCGHSHVISIHSLIQPQAGPLPDLRPAAGALKTSRSSRQSEENVKVSSNSTVNVVQIGMLVCLLFLFEV